MQSVYFEDMTLCQSAELVLVVGAVDVDMAVQAVGVVRVQTIKLEDAGEDEVAFNRITGLKDGWAK